jgi:hypothetical protein
MLFVMKTKGLFTNCILTSEGPLFCGETTGGVQIFAHNDDVVKGFRLFSQYVLHIDEKSIKQVYGQQTETYVCAKIQRSIYFGQIPEVLRLQMLYALCIRVSREVRSGILNFENIISFERLVSLIRR